MTFQDIYTEVLSARFKSSQTASIKRWVNMREAQIWAAAEWHWKIVGPTSLAITAADDTPTIAADMSSPLSVYDANGEPLWYYIQADFNDMNLPLIANAIQGTPGSYTWNNLVLTLSPVPDTNYTYTYTYYRKIAHFAAGGAITTGAMSLDSDYPIFDDSWHEILTLGALSTGLKVENDPTWESLEGEYTAMLGSMIDQYLPSVAVASNMQYGRDTL